MPRMEGVRGHGLAFGSPPKADISLLTHEIHPMVGGIAAGCGGSAPLNVIAFKTLTVPLEWLPPCGFVVVVITDINCKYVLFGREFRSAAFSFSSIHRFLLIVYLPL